MTIKLSHGNKKLVSNQDTRFLIWSIPPVSTCPYSTALCRKFCYAMKAFKAYPNARNAWAGNYEESLAHDFVESMLSELWGEISKPKYNKAKQIIVRIHESGDFYSKEYAVKWLNIAWNMELFKAVHPNADKVKFMAYTKSVEFFKGEDIPANMTVRFSLWDDTEPEQLAIAESMGLPIYTAVEEFTTEPRRERCGCVDCAKCSKCWNAKFAMLKCEIH